MSTNQCAPKKRNWDQFTLNIALVVAGLLAWAMAYWPWLPMPAFNTSKVPVNTSIIPMGRDVAMLLQNLDAKYASKRDNAARYLGELGANGELGENADKVLAKLKKLAKKDPIPNVRATATEAITKIEGGD